MTVYSSILGGTEGGSEWSERIRQLEAELAAERAITEQLTRTVRALVAESEAAQAQVRRLEDQVKELRGVLKYVQDISEEAIERLTEPKGEKAV